MEGPVAVINFRFHLISLVAVFLALGVGVAMGASFVDRATVESLRSRVDDLDGAYRRRGGELDATQDQLARSDAQAAALAGEASEALSDRLPTVPVVILATDDVDADVLDATRTSLAAAGASTAGTVRLQPPLSSPASAELDAIRARFGVKGDATAVRDRIASDLGTALAHLSAAPPPPVVPTTTTTVTGAPESPSVAPSPVDADTARLYVGALSDLGLLTVVDSEVGSQDNFPRGSGYRYVVVDGRGGTTDDGVVTTLATSESNRSPRTMVVAETASARPPGEATTTTSGQAERGASLAELRKGDVADALSTVDDLGESFGRIALVYAMAEQRDSGRVGHYGTGVGATAPFPTVPPS